MKKRFAAAAITLLLLSGCMETADVEPTAKPDKTVSEISDVSFQTNDSPYNEGSDDAFSDTVESESSPAVTGDFAKNLPDITDCLEYTADDSEYSTEVIFTAKRDIEDFSLLAINMESVSDDGSAVFREETLYEFGDLTKERSLKIRLSFPGDMPNYAISYRDSDGTLKKYAFQESGRDGSFIMFEI